MKFYLLYDKLTYTLTFFCLFIIFGLPTLFFLADNNLCSSLIFLAINCTILAPAIALAPRYYMLQEDKIIIKKVIGKIVIHNNDIENITTIDSKVTKGLFRKFASGGFLGWYGLFSSNTLKNVSMWAGSISKNLVLIKLKSNKSYIITPKELEVFMDTVKDVNQ